MEGYKRLGAWRVESTKPKNTLAANQPLTMVHYTHRLAPLVCLSSVAAVLGSPAASCTGSISSLDDISDAVKCTTVNINSFTVPAGEGFNLTLATGSTVNMREYLACIMRTSRRSQRWKVGDVTFGNKTWDGPLFQIR